MRFERESGRRRRHEFFNVPDRSRPLLSLSRSRYRSRGGGRRRRALREGYVEGREVDVRGAQAKLEVPVPLARRLARNLASVPGRRDCELDRRETSWTRRAVLLGAGRDRAQFETRARGRRRRRRGRASACARWRLRLGQLDRIEQGTSPGSVRCQSDGTTESRVSPKLNEKSFPSLARVGQLTTRERGWCRLSRCRRHSDRV